MNFWGFIIVFMLLLIDMTLGHILATLVEIANHGAF